ncbi:MAG: DUF5711 family protein [Ruminococcus sp.]|nr:DUF5711 family protein [Ruminococcus sp.]
MSRNNKARYGEQKTKKINRDVMSYEDMPLDDYEQEKTEIAPEAVKKMLMGVCAALFVCLIVFAFANRQNLTWDNISAWWTYDVLGTAGGGYPVNIVGSQVSAENITVSQNRTAYASDTSFVTLNNTGNEIANLQLKYSTPVMKSSGTRFLTYGLNDKRYQIFDIESERYSGEAEANIYTGDISSSGVYCLVTDGNGYLSVLYAFDKNNNRIYKYSFSEFYITSVSVNSDGTGCIACGISSSEGAVTSGVYILDFGKETPVNTYRIADDSIISCKYLGNRYSAIGQNAQYVFKNNSDKYVTNSYKDRTLTNFCYNTDTNTCMVALSKSGDGRSCMLVEYNSNGDERFTVDTNYGAESIATYKGVVAVLSDNMIYTFNSDGRQLYASNAGTGSKKLILASENTAYVLSVNQIRKIDLKNTSTDDTAK